MHQEGMRDIDEANINDLDDYIQYYYEENIDHKIEATRKILLLTLDMKNIEILLNHDSLMGTLSRILKEEYKKSTELTIYLLCIFFVYSNY